MGNFSVNERNILRTCSLLSELSDENFNTFIEISDKASFEKGEILLREGEQSDYLYIIISGDVELYKNVEENDSQQLIGTLSSGQSVGEIRIIRNRTCSLTVKASAPTIVLYTLISKLCSPEYRNCYEGILDSLTCILSDRLMTSNQTIVSKTNKKSNKFKYRLLSLLLVATLVLLLCELGFALYYLRHPIIHCP